MGILYIEKIENHRIGNRTPSTKIANSLGWSITKEEDELEYAFDGSLWEKGHIPNELIEKEQENEQTRIAMLNLTAADVERAIYKAKGLDFDDVIALVEAQPLSEDGTEQIDIKALKIELRANNFYRGNPYINQVGTLLGFTSKQLDEFFETNDYTKLMWG